MDAIGELEARLRAAGVTGDVRIFTEPVPTAAAAAVALGCAVGAIANSLIFQVDAAPLLVLASGAGRVDTRALARRLSCGKIGRANPEFVLRHTGQRIGGVAPVGHPQLLRTIVDIDLAQHPVVWAGAGDEMTMFATTFDELVQLTGGTAGTVR